MAVHMSSNDIKQSMGLAEWTMLITLSVLWGGSFFTVGVAVQELPPLTIVVARVALAAAGLWAFMLVTSQPLPKGARLWAAFFGMGLLNNAIPFTLIVWGQTQLASGLASILNATAPLFTVLVASAFTRDERLTPLKLTGVVTGLAGVAWMIGGTAIAGLGDAVVAQLAVLGAACSYGFAGVFGRRFRSMGVTPVATATGQVTASSVLLLPVMLLVDKPWTLAMPGMATIAAVLALALVCTSAAYILYFRILAVAGATNLSLVTLLIPPVAILLGIAFLDEVLQLRHLVGMALIFAGLVLIDGRLPARLRARIA
jgi:drug/metabolite transporter (DMT)-like permease